MSALRRVNDPLGICPYAEGAQFGSPLGRMLEGELFVVLEGRSRHAPAQVQILSPRYGICWLTEHSFSEYTEEV